MQKSFSESSEDKLSVDDVIKSGPLNMNDRLSHDVIGCKPRVKFVDSHWSVSICLLLY